MKTITLDVASTAMFSIERVIKTLDGVEIVEQRATQGACGYTTITLTQEA